ncbi:MAG TPA: PBP1A family penicillin-binding protein [Acidimicrobiales bacterium]|nr:PBP1A family penicillin-binding protein [Acidimicrobiales bacterium]
MTSSRAKTEPRARRKKTQRSVFWRFRRSLFLAGLLVVAGFAGAGFVLSQVALPPETPLRQTTFVCAADVSAGCDETNAMASLSAEEDRINVTLDQVSPRLIEAVVAAEDRDFFSHQGVDPIGITRAALSDFRGSESQQGGSTITQQYVKNVYLTSERTITRKIKEAVLAVKLERELEKDEILERYLNTIYFGRGAYGVQAASRAYFGTDASDLLLYQAAYLAGLIRAPESADATRDPATATFRRHTVLVAMLDEGYIDQAAFDEADALEWNPLTVVERTPREGLGRVTGSEFGSEYFVEYVRQQLIAEYGEDVVYGGGLRVYTTIDLGMQEDAHRAVTETLNEPDDPSGSIVAVDNNGYIKAMVGGTDFANSEVNLALGADGGGSGRQPGSSFKPLVLADALRKGISPESKFDSPASITLPNANAGEDWKVRNYAESSQGVLDLVDATRVSSNTAYAQLMLEVGPESVVDLAHRLGISADLPEVNSLVLGAGEVSVLDMAAAYSTFANRGVAKEPTPILRVEKIEDDGSVTVLQNVIPAEEEVLTTDQADTLNWILRQVVLNGTGTGADIGRPMAGKTGTTQDNRDAWFVGYTPRLTAAVWMGYPGEPGAEPRFMKSVRGRSVTGGSFPASIWKSFMSNALEGIDTGSFEPPPPFVGAILNSDLSTTTTDPCADVATPRNEDGSIDYSDPCAPPEPTTDPCADSSPATLEDGSADPDDPCRPKSTTSTTRAPSTTSSSRPSTTTTSTSSTSTSTTSTSTTAKPPP